LGIECYLFTPARQAYHYHPSDVNDHNNKHQRTNPQSNIYKRFYVAMNRQ